MFMKIDLAPAVHNVIAAVEKVKKMVELMKMTKVRTITMKIFNQAHQMKRSQSLRT